MDLRATPSHRPAPRAWIFLAALSSVLLTGVLLVTVTHGLVARRDAEMTQIREKWAVKRLVNEMNRSGFQARQLNDWEGALASYERVRELDRGNVEALGSLARIRGLCPDPRYVDLKLAEQFAREACIHSSFRNARSLSLLASICAKQGNLAAAIRYQELAVAFTRNRYRKPFVEQLLILQAQRDRSPQPTQQLVTLQ